MTRDLLGACPAPLRDRSTSPLEVSRRRRPYLHMARAPYVSYTFGGEPKLRVGPGQGRAEPAMKRNRKYRDEPLGRLEVVKDFLPPPDQLVLRDDGVKITISLSKRSVDFFKRHAARSKVPYQKMIRSLLDTYAKHHGAEL